VPHPSESATVLHPPAPRERPTPPTLRRATADDLTAMATADGRGFGMHYTDTDIEDFRPLFDPDRFLLAQDPADGAKQDGPILGITGSFPFDVTLPGGTTLPAPGVTWVSVAVTHRRQGILRAMMEEQHRGFVADASAVSLLTASEGAIYGRFGYGIATVHRCVEISRRRAAFRPGAPDPGGVRQVDPHEARLLLPDIHRRWSALVPGALSRSETWWDNHMLDRESRRGGATALFYLVHDDGYASYRIERGDRTCQVAELVSVTEEAHAALWRVLLALDLVETVARWSHPLDDPLQYLLADPRQVRTTRIRDGMWARILDVPAALSARRYAAELDVVLDVHDPFLELGGRFRLRGGPDGARCERLDAGGPSVAVDVTALGSLLFGGERAVTLARAGLLETDDPGALRRVDTAFLADRLPQHGTEF
jgi:predicted acetyltransferase